MKSVKICYTNRDNFGDSVNPIIIENIFKIASENTSEFQCEISGIGSGLRRFFINTENFSLKKRVKTHIEKYMRATTRPLILWSAGFLATPTGNEMILRKNMNVASVRGEHSKQWVEKLINKKLDCSTGDGGLLVSELIPKQEKKYCLGIIPHDKERGESAFSKIQDSIPNSVIIDVRGNVIENLKTIAQCECIISSSLHGLIFADSFHVPNRQVVLTDRLSGDGFKFHDYYSSFNVKANPLDINTEHVDIDLIKEEYPITVDRVEKMKSDIKEAFLRYL